MNSILAVKLSMSGNLRKSDTLPLHQRFLACDLSWHADVGYYSYTDSYEQESPL